MAEVTQADLLPCPFCGTDQCAVGVWTVDDDNLPYEDQEPVAWGVGCSCSAAMGPFSDEGSATSAWNTRHRTEAVNPLVEALGYASVMADMLDMVVSRWVEGVDLTDDEGRKATEALMRFHAAIEGVQS